jgi:hypothetical protein
MINRDVLRKRITQSLFGVIWDDLFPAGRDVRSGLAHGFGRAADILRGHKMSITAIEREEAALRRSEELRKAWRKRMAERRGG